MSVELGADKVLLSPNSGKLHPGEVVCISSQREDNTPSAIFGDKDLAQSCDSGW